MFLSRLFCFFLLGMVSFHSLSSDTVDEAVFYTSSDDSSLKYIYHRSGNLAWDGVNAYHSNFEVAYTLGSDGRARIYYDDGSLIWKGLTFDGYKKLYRGELSDAKFYFRNGKQIWAGVTYKDWLKT
jgi:hypothetical protein